MKLKHTRYANIQLIVFALFTIISAVFLDWSLKNRNQVFVYLAIVFFALMVVSLIAEALIYKNHRPIARITVSIILLLVAILLFFQKETPGADPEMSPFELGGFALLLSVWIIFMMSVFANLLLVRATRREGEGDVSAPVTQLNPPLKGYLPVGFFCKKHLIFYYVSILSAIILTSGLFFVLQFLVYDNLLINALILFVVLFVSLIAIIFLFSYLTNAPFRHFEKDLDFHKIITLIDEYRANPKLHPETSNYLLLIKANYMINYDTELAASLWKDVVVPTNPAFRLTYDLVLISRLTWELDFSGAQNYLTEALNSAKQQNAKAAFNHRLKMNKAFQEGTSEAEVEIMWPLESKIKLLVIQNLTSRILYYTLQSNLERANQYFNDLKALSPESSGVIKTIDTLLLKAAPPSAEQKVAAE